MKVVAEKLKTHFDAERKYDFLGSKSIMIDCIFATD